MEEELTEVRTELVKTPPSYNAAGAAMLDERHDALESELGDLLFAVVNLCRKAGVHASLALDKANGKFERRFTRMQEIAKERGLDFPHLGLEKLDRLWDEAKRRGSAS